MANKRKPKTAKSKDRRKQAPVPGMRNGKTTTRNALQVQMGIYEDLIAQGLSFERVAELLTQPEPAGFGVAEATLRNWDRAIRHRWALEAKGARDVVKAEHRARLGMLFRRAIERDGVLADKVALDVEKTWLQVDGVIGPQPIGGTTVNVNIAALTPMQRRAEIEQLLEKRRRVLDTGRTSAIDVAAVERT